MPTEVRRIRKNAGLTQEEAAQECGIPLRTFADYDRGETEPPSDRMAHIRSVLGGHDPSFRDLPSSVSRVRVQHAGAGPGQAPDGEEQILLDERLLAGSGVDFDAHEFIRVQGSSMEPVLSHGQIVFVEPVDGVRGQDVYVYWRGDEQGYVVAIVESTTSGLLIEKKGPRPSSVEWAHQKDHIYESENGETVELRIFGRVLGSFGSPAQQIAAQNQAARHGAMAAQV